MRKFSGGPRPQNDHRPSFVGPLRTKHEAKRRCNYCQQLRSHFSRCALQQQQLLLLHPTASLFSPPTETRGRLDLPCAGMMSRHAILRILVFLLSLPGFLSPLATAIWLNLPPSGSKCVSEEIQANVIVLADYTVVHEDRGRQLPTISAKTEKSTQEGSNKISAKIKIQRDVSVAGGEISFADGCVSFAGHPTGEILRNGRQIFRTKGALLVTSPYGNNLHLKENVTSNQFAFTTSDSGKYLACFWVDGLQKGIGASVNLDWKIGIAAKDWLTVARKEKIEGVELELRKLKAAVETIHENLLYLRTREADTMAMNETTKSRLAWYSAAALGMVGKELCIKYQQSLPFCFRVGLVLVLMWSYHPHCNWNQMNECGLWKAGDCLSFRRVKVPHKFPLSISVQSVRLWGEQEPFSIKRGRLLIDMPAGKALAPEAGAKSRAKASGEILSRLEIEYYSRIGERVIRW
ncbi:hypothetical protein ACLOJK_013804 [Asimina triloba]